MAPASHRDLIAWRKAMDLLVVAHDIAGRLPEPLQPQLAAELRVTSLAIPSRIAAGHGRDELQGYMSALDVAHGEVHRLESLLDAATLLGGLAPADPLAARARELCTEIARMLDTLMVSLRAREGPGV